jgi:D-alanyl-D-alanine carboxypeptidase/D-alanyl-D-alanine-endopeptidase (penicillin-binding protein 4)
MAVAGRLIPALCLVLTLLAPVSGNARDGLPRAVSAVLEHRGIPADSLSVWVAKLAGDDDVVLAWNADEPRNPASVMKLVTTLAALDTLGPTYTWKTEVYLRGDVEGETLDGDLLLKGYGDPFLVSERFWQIVRAVRRAGIQRITGDLLLDDSWFDVGDYDPGAFDNEPLRAYNVAPNALMVNFKALRYQFEPDFTTATVSVSLYPEELANLQVVNDLRLQEGHCRGYQRGITMIANETMDEVMFSGAFPSGCGSYSLYRTALGHNEFAYGMFRTMWRELGGELDGEWKNVVLEESDDEPLVSFESVPLAQVIAQINKHSNNVMARQLVLTLAAEKYGPPGTVENGRKAIGDWLRERELPVDSLFIDNGAGLSRKARVSASDVGELLRYAWQSPFMPEYMASLSLAGMDGTLAGRLAGTPLAGRAHLKTGSLDDVTAIAGYVQARSGDRYVVVALHNHPGVHRGPGEEVQQALLRWVYNLR